MYLFAKGAVEPSFPFFRAGRKGLLIFDRKMTGTGLFEAKSLLELAAPPATVAPAVSGILRPAREPEFLTERNFYRTSWWSRLGTILSRYPAQLKTFTAKLTLFRDVPVRPRRFAAKQLAVSLVLHGCAFLLLPTLLRYLPFQVARAANLQVADQPVIYYHLSNPEHQPKTPRIMQPGPGSAPGSGTAPELPPVSGATAQRAALFAISRPRVPDNDHQTILQPLTQPDLKVKVDLKLPNLFLSKPVAPKAPLHFNPQSVKPLQREVREVAAVAPTLNPNNPQPLTDALAASNDHPKLAVPLGAPPAPNLPSRDTGSSAVGAAPEFEANGASGQGLLVLGTNPGDSPDVALPPGNRYGQFSIAPGGTGSGSPGGQPSGSANGGAGGGNGGGNESTGAGAGTSGGGGGNSGTPGIVSMRGSGGNNVAIEAGEPERLANFVFALPKLSPLRRDALMVAAGPMGGGGLSVYGALHCGKIFTVFLPAPGKSWTLQFCQTRAPNATPPPAPKAYASVVHMEEALVPPEAEERFDFQRTALPFEKLHKYVVLKGRITEEGKVADLSVYQGLSDEMDAAAKYAFNKWTFRPATKGSKAVSVDILVGIPSDPPKATSPGAKLK